jgi:hypothetical protein
MAVNAGTLTQQQLQQIASPEIRFLRSVAGYITTDIEACILDKK